MIKVCNLISLSYNIILNKGQGKIRVKTYDNVCIAELGTWVVEYQEAVICTFHGNSARLNLDGCLYASKLIIVETVNKYSTLFHLPCKNNGTIQETIS